MIKEIGLLLRLRFCNFLGINEAKHQKEKRKSAIAMLLLFAFVGVYACFYVGFLSYFIASVGLAKLMPVFLTLVTSLIIFVFTLFKAGSDIFDYKYYESLAHLPIKKSSIITAKLIGMYITDAGISLLVFLSGAVGVSVFQAESFLYYPMMVLSALLVPVLPIALSCFLGAGVYALSCRLKRAKLISSIALCLLVVLLYLVPTLLPNELDENQMILAIEDLARTVSGIYPPAFWVSQGILGNDIGLYILFVGLSVVVAVGFVMVFAKVYQRVALALGSAVSKHRKVEISRVKASSPFIALYKKEWKKLLSSTTYLTNSIIGYVIVIFGSVLLLVQEVEIVLPIEDIGIIFVGALSIFANMSSTTTASIGIEGRSFDTLKTLPVSSREVLGAKLALGLTFSIPTGIVMAIACAISDITSTVPLWISIPAPLIFAVGLPELGLLMNVKFPSLEWADETYPVKRGKAVLFTMLISFAIGFIFIGLGVAVGELAVLALLLVVTALTVWGYSYLSRVDVSKIS